MLTVLVLQVVDRESLAGHIPPDETTITRPPRRMSASRNVIRWANTWVAGASLVSCAERCDRAASRRRCARGMQ